MLFKLFFAKEYPTNKTLNTANKILMKKKNKINFPEKILCDEKLPKFEQHFKLVSRIVTLNLLTRKSTDKNTPCKNANFLNIYLNKTIRLPW
jgi:hypothetical protein